MGLNYTSKIVVTCKWEVPLMVSVAIYVPRFSSFLDVQENIQFTGVSIIPIEFVFIYIFICLSVQMRNKFFNLITKKNNKNYVAFSDELLCIFRVFF